MLRVFFALQPAAGSGARLLEAAAPLLTGLQAAPVPETNLHATLCFVGAVEPARLDALREAAATVRAAACELTFDTFEYWDEPRVLVAAASSESREAAMLSSALHIAATAAGFTPDAKPFRPHLTLARKIPAAQAEKIPWPQKFSPGFVVRSTEFVLMESRRGELGSIYSALDSWPLYETSGLRITQ